MARLVPRVLDAVYPPLCVGCTAPIDSAHALCPACWSEMTFVSGLACAKCGLPLPGEAEETALCDLCLAHPPAWDSGRAAFLYDGAGRRVVLAFKHGDRPDLARPLARWMADAGRALLARAEIVAPIPLHWRRTLSRTYNQSAELARQHSLAGGRIVLPALLDRVRPTESQDGKSRQARFANQAGAIVVTPRQAAQVAGRSVLLIDDVMTTGATLSAATEACRGAGAARVDVLVLARVARDAAAAI